MNAIRTAGLCLAAGLLVGCQSKQPTRAPERAPAPIQAAESLRASIMRADPEAQVGIVAAALPDAQLVAVRDVPADQMQVGSLVQFVDVDRNAVGTGTVVMIKNGALHVRYDGDGTRPPQVGDLALRVNGGAMNAGSSSRLMDAAEAEAASDAAATDTAAPADASAPADAGGTHQPPPPRGGAAPSAPAQPVIQPEAQPAAQPETPAAQPEVQPEAQPAAQPEAAPADAAAEPKPADDAAAAPSDAAPSDAAPAEKPADAPAPVAEKAAGQAEADKPDLKK